MAPQIKKLWRRLSLISTSAGYNLSSTFFNLGVSILVIRLVNAALWGDLVQILLWTSIAMNVIAWGNKDFLIRQFSLSPASLRQEWQRSFGSRSLLFLLALCLLIFFPLNPSLKWWIAVYLSARFIYLSYDSLIIFRRAFFVTIILESAGFILTGTSIIIFHPGETTVLFSFFALAELVKAISVIIYFKAKWLPVFFKNFDWNYFGIAFSFFILYFSGMLSSKIDLVFVTHFFSKEGIARYQVLINFLLLLQALPAMILLPFLKNIYRVKADVVKKIALRLFVSGIFISCAAVLFIKEIVQFLYGFNYDVQVFFFAWLLVLPGFYFSPVIYRLFKQKQQQVVIISVAFILCAAAFIFIFLKLFPDKIAGVLAAMATAHWIKGAIYYFVWNENKLMGKRGEKARITTR